MNRRSFLTRLGAAAVGAAALSIEDPERLLWVPGAKTIVDFGATKQVVPATNAELAEQFKTRVLTASPDAPTWVRNQFVTADRGPFGLDGPRDIILTMGGAEPTTFRYQDDRLVSLHTPEELAKLDRTFVTYHEARATRAAQLRRLRRRSS